MTELLYFDDCYIKEWTTTVEKAKKKGKQVVLQKSAFYPEGGGQPTDKGYLYANGKKFRVHRVEKRGKDVWHYLDRGRVDEGTEVKAELDWDRRYKHMRMHSAQHLLSAILLDHYDAATAGNQIHTEYSRMDFNPFDPTEEDLEFIEEKFNELVDDGRELKKYIVDRERVPELVEDPKRLRLFKRVPDFVKRIRIVEIVGVDKDPCAGTHVKNTNEIGHLHIRDTENKGKNITRLVFDLYEP
ncbi:MAG: alanyl-tRNA editing protein [Candidatus Korarchaeota archaeon]|nr:alanyl-tRNA editing protein [Candidatus Korarchaeota archaeon]NIU84569.1 alanyl-tRNA editing protein [Candidatus Thorarchaeota archaeon]NIW14627.1 alanyl-tRNA editing protein [Candidatus Thorarchaeota archaeon]NIW52704.1 alanyl-tRNA editing protein [Candidatus Korarchaeota archaeon]